MNTDRGNTSVQWVEPSASDNFQSVTLTGYYKPGDDFPIGDTIVTYIATDKSGNSANATFRVTVLTGK